MLTAGGLVKSGLVSTLLLSFTISAAFTSDSVTVRPDSQSYATGYVRFRANPSDYDKLDSSISWGRYYNEAFWEFYRGWAKFNLASIPDSAIIDSTRLAFYVRSVRHTAVNICKVDPDPVAETSASRLFPLLRTGNPFASVAGPTMGWNQVRLSGEADTVIMSRLPLDWIALSWSTPDSILTWDCAAGWPGPSLPLLTVYYHIAPGGVAERPGAFSGTTLSISPNPVARGSVAASYSARAGQFAELALFDEAGRLVRTVTRGRCRPGINTCAIDAAALAPGIYFVTLAADRATISAKLAVR
jgi:hypothetical protein